MTRFGISQKLCPSAQNLVFATASRQAAKLPVCQSMAGRPETMCLFPQLDQEQKTDYTPFIPRWENTVPSPNLGKGINSLLQVRKNFTLLCLPLI